MKCPRCECETTRVRETHTDYERGVIFRTRFCPAPNCLARWRTVEQGDPTDPNYGFRPGERKHWSKMPENLGSAKRSLEALKAAGSKKAQERRNREIKEGLIVVPELDPEE